MNTLLEDQYPFLIITRSAFLRIRSDSDKIWRQNQNTHFLSSRTSFRNSCRLWDNLEKFCTVGQVTDYNMAHAHCMRDA